MAFINPVYGLIVPLLCVFTIPVAALAGITTTIAFSVMMFRAALVYINIVMAFIPQFLMGGGPRAIRIAPRYSPRGYDGPEIPGPSSSAPGGGLTSTTTTAYHARAGANRRERGLPAFDSWGPSRIMMGRRSRRPSQGSSSSAGTITPINEFDDGVTGASGGLALAGSPGMNRDFEGIGGWRLDNRGGDDDGWTRINSRLELPPRHHYRSSSGEVALPGDGSWLMMKSSRKEQQRPPDARARDGKAAMHAKKPSVSPNSSRVRSSQVGSTTPTYRDREEGYFGYLPRVSSQASGKKTPG